MKDIDLTDFDFNKDVTIDVNMLEIEWIRQPMLAEKYGVAWSTARYNVDALKLRLDIVISDLDREARNAFTAEKIKYTEAMVTHAIHKDERYDAINKELIQAKYTQENLGMAVKAIDQRKNALENLVKLLGLQYFGAPTEPRSISDIMEIMSVSEIQKNQVFDKVSRKLKKSQ
jgi:hypothetical protein